MRASIPDANLALIARQIEIAPWTDHLRASQPRFEAASPATIEAILIEAARFAADRLVSLNDEMDSAGCAMIDGRVQTTPHHRDAWSAFVEAGWPTLDADEAVGGQALPAILSAAVQEQFDRACPAFGMLPVPQRSAAKLIAAHGTQEMREEWLPNLASGEWGATICISEVEAGSDVGRIRTKATLNTDGSWSLSGEKCWISFGDQDLTQRIGHCVLARTPNGLAGGAGLSLFLVPDTLDVEGKVQRNAITLRRIEHKMGLHGSPTCALGFEGAKGWLIGTESRGLAQMFVMITQMRIAVATMGLGIASAACDTALAYAEERRQGGGSSVPLAIAEHSDVQRQLLAMVSRVDILRGLLFALANLSDIATHDANGAARDDAQALAQWLLPIVKTLGGETAFDVASDAVQVLGGAGYTREWPVEQSVRDARVLPVFEGTTGIQALDLLHRRLLRDGHGYHLFIQQARAAARRCAEAEGANLDQCLNALDSVVNWMREETRSSGDRDTGATALLSLASLAASGWIAAHHSQVTDDDPSSRRLRASGRFLLRNVGISADKLAAEATQGHMLLSDFQDVRPVPRVR